MGARDNKHPLLRMITIAQTIDENIVDFNNRARGLPSEIYNEFYEERQFVIFCARNDLEIPSTLKWTIL